MTPSREGLAGCNFIISLVGSSGLSFWQRSKRHGSLDAVNALKTSVWGSER
jgi:hypothetical protein